MINYKNIGNFLINNFVVDHFAKFSKESLISIDSLNPFLIGQVEVRCLDAILSRELGKLIKSDQLQKYREFDDN